ncbi:transmembrane protein 230 [Teleopsis dalmanni]|uniref:transmembrane protein 230 n=1 Tax=Teleopsis dalmanni TaxID=139649 RepID=UPI0018CEAD07|nr:transmembrane protein 230 [Teleopsis dalmanni]
MSQSRRRVNAEKYTKLESDKRAGRDEGDDGFVVEQFAVPPRKIQWKAVFFIVCFLIVGGVCLTAGLLISMGYFEKKYADRSYPLIIMGVIMFIPGGYYGYILLCVLCKRHGFSYDDVPRL